MKFLLSLLCFTCFLTFGQTKNFQLSDTTFSVGQEINLDIRFQANARFLIDSVTFEMMDSIENFVLSHPNLVIEIQCNTDCRGDSLYNLKLSEQRALGIKYWLEGNGAKSENIETNSQGERKPFLLTPENSLYYKLPKELQNNENHLLSETFVKQFKENKELFQALNMLNHRTVFRIISVG